MTADHDHNSMQVALQRRTDDCVVLKAEIDELLEHQDLDPMIVAEANRKADDIERRALELRAKYATQAST